MGFSELLLIAVGLSMDAFAVAVCKGLKMRRLDIGKTAVIAIFRRISGIDAATWLGTR